VRVWDVENGHQVFEVDHPISGGCAVAYSPNGQYIVIASGEKTIGIWDANTGAAVTTLFGHTDCVRSVVFTPDGRSLVSGGDDRTIRIWDVEAAVVLSSQNGARSHGKASIHLCQCRWLARGILGRTALVVTTGIPQPHPDTAMLDGHWIASSRAYSRRRIALGRAMDGVLAQCRKY